MMTVVQTLLLFLSFQAVLLAILFFFKKSEEFRGANRIFSAFLLCGSWLICYNVFYWSKYLFSAEYSHFNFTYTIPLSLLGPLFFFYIRDVTKGQKFEFRKDFYHLIPMASTFLLYFPYYSLNAKQKAATFEIRATDKVNYISDFWEVGVVGLMVVYMVYWNSHFLQHFKGDRNLSLWLKGITICFAGLIASFSTFYTLYFLKTITMKEDYAITITMAAFVLFTAYFAFNFPQIFNGKSIQKVVPFVKYKNTGLTENYSLALREKLTKTLEKDRLYLDRELRLDKLANELGVARHHLSQVINEHFQSSFFDFINRFRVEESIKLIKEESSNYNIADIAFLSGFNNTVSFNRAFKKQTGQTPSNYRKSLEEFSTS